VDALHAILAAPMTVDDIQRLGDVLEPLSGRDLVALWNDDEAMEMLRYSLKRLASDDFVTEMVGAEGGLTGTFPGPEGFIEGWRDFLDAFETFQNVIQEVLPVGDKIVVLNHLKGTTATGGVGMEQEGAGVFTFADGELTRAEFHLDRAAALKAAGIGKQD
jgi:ketosteroid isomerase-like protein